MIFNNNPTGTSVARYLILPTGKIINYEVDFEKSLRYRILMGKWINWKQPKLYQEKLQWLKVYNRQKRYTEMVDKITAKDYAARIIGEKYIIPTLGVWDDFDEIDFEKLPNQFVLKTNNGGGNMGVIVCKNKSLLNNV